MAGSYPYPLRLRGPWNYEVLDGEPARGRMTVPGDWSAELGAEFRGRVRLTRRFGRPAKLDARERLWLVIEGADPQAEVTVNGEHLGTVAGYAVPAEWDIHALTGPRNLLELDVRAGADVPRPGRESLAGGLPAEIRLEVRRPASLSQVAFAWHDDPDNADEVRLAVRGYTAGRIPGDDPTAGHPLRLEVVAGWGTLLQEPVEPEAFFHFERRLPRWAGPLPDTPAGWGPLAEIEVRLVAGDEILWQRSWHTFHRPVYWDATQHALTVGQHTFRIPDDVTSEGPCRLSWQVLTTEAYRRCAERGTLLVQQMPAAWAGELCGMLAHHPAIVAWTAPEAQLRTLPGSLREGTFHGRPWIATELLTG